MKKFILNLLKFVALALPFYIIVLFLWSWVMPPFMAKNVRNCIGCYGHLFTRSRDAAKIKNPDILFLGSSHSYRGFDTRIFEKHGYKTFNFGSSSQTPINTNVLIKQYLDIIQPKMVVYEVYVGTLQSDGVESSLDLLSNNKIDRNVLDMVFQVNNLLTYNTLIFGSFKQILNLDKNFNEPINYSDDFYIKNGGYVQTKFRKNIMKEEKISSWNINPMQWKKLLENIEILKQKNIPYILVQSPISSKLYNSKTNNKEIDEKLSHLGIYKNFQGEVPLNDTIDFFDSNHLNQSGVERFNEKFIIYLQNLKNK